MSIEAMAVAFVAATKKRAQARSHLSKLRKKWLDETGEFFDKDESRGGEEGPYDEMVAALKAREDANADYRRAKGRLFRACALGVAEVPTSLYWCSKCGYRGPEQINHQRPNGTGECGYIAKPLTDSVEGKS